MAEPPRQRERQRQRRWMILAYQLPSRPSNLRVRVWRRLQQVGAVVLRNSLYVLPSTDEAREDFNWVREEIVSSGGQVSILEASSVDGFTDTELVQLFRAARNAEYRALAAEIRAQRRALMRLRRRSLVDRALRRFRERFSTIVGRDMFDADAKADAVDALTEFETAGRRTEEKVHHVPLARAQFRRRTWVTRPRPGIDRMASAWLIRRFIAPDARFAFVSSPAGFDSRRVPFDMPNVDFGHHGPHCTFETLMHAFRIRDRGVRAIAQMVHDLDLKEERYAMPERVAVGRIVDGLRAAHADDAELLEHGMGMIDALYRSFSAEAGTRRRTRRRTRR